MPDALVLARVALRSSAECSTRAGRTGSFGQGEQATDPRACRVRRAAPRQSPAPNGLLSSLTHRRARREMGSPFPPSLALFLARRLADHRDGLTVTWGPRRCKPNPLYLLRFLDPPKIHWISEVRYASLLPAKTSGSRAKISLLFATSGMPQFTVSLVMRASSLRSPSRRSSTPRPGPTCASGSRDRGGGHPRPGLGSRGPSHVQAALRGHLHSSPVEEYRAGAGVVVTRGGGRGRGPPRPLEPDTRWARGRGVDDRRERGAPAPGPARRRATTATTYTRSMIVAMPMP